MAVKMAAVLPAKLCYGMVDYIKVGWVRFS